MTRTHHVTLHPRFGPPAAGSSTAGDDDRFGRHPGASGPAAKLDAGLAFYWTLAASVSDATGAEHTLLTFGSAGRGEQRMSKGGATTAEAGRRHGRERRQLHVPPDVPVGLEIDAPPPDDDGDPDGSARLDALLRSAGCLVAGEQCRRSLLYSRSVAESFERRAGHELRTLLHPLALQVSQLRRTESPSTEDLELLDELTRSLVEWTKSDLGDGELLRSVRRPSHAGSDRTRLDAALEDVLAREDVRDVTSNVADRVPDLPVDRAVLESGLLELLRFGGDVPRALEVAPRRESDVLLRVEFERNPACDGSDRAPSKTSSGTPDHPPVVGGLLNLVAWMDGTLLVESRRESGGGLEVRLPTAAP